MAHVASLLFPALLLLAVVCLPQESHAAAEMDALKAMMAEHLVCHPVELVRHEKQQLAVSYKNLCLASVYQRTGLAPLWVTPEGPGARASVVRDCLVDAGSEGLDPEKYEADEISALFSRRDPRSLARLDTLLTFNLIKYVQDVTQGQIRPDQEDPALLTEAEDVNFRPVTIIENAFDAPDLAAYLAALPPRHRHYVNLKRALAIYRNLESAGGWPVVAIGNSIRPGDEDPRMTAVIRRLAATGDLDPAVPPASYYDPFLESAVVRFQARHGLSPDGVIGKNTIAAMNVPVSETIRQIIINMTRWRWQEHELGEKYVLVNIAHFDLSAFEGGKEAFSFPVIVGKFQHQTPVFSDRIIYVEFNPYWNVPPSIAKNEDLPKLRRDPGYLAKRRVRLFSSWGADAREIDSRSVDWANMTPSRMGRFKLRQDPGPWNALGRVKFVFPNTYDVYLHDTPTQNLFSRTTRNFSHGCIRVSDPVKLASFVLTEGENTWNPAQVEAVIREGKRRVVRLREPLPVHITYQTAWVDKNGIIYFNRDVYGRDEALLKALFKH